MSEIQSKHRFLLECGKKKLACSLTGMVSEIQNSHTLVFFSQTHTEAQKHTTDERKGKSCLVLCELHPQDTHKTYQAGSHKAVCGCVSVRDNTTARLYSTLLLTFES